MIISIDAEKAFDKNQHPLKIELPYDPAIPLLGTVYVQRK